MMISVCWNSAIDRAPEVAFLEFPGPTHQQALRVDYEARDDYGIVKLEMTIRLVV